MVAPSADRTTEWEGGSLAELVAVLQAAALPVRIEVIAPGTTDSNAGEVHLLAGGLADAFAGSLRRDDAMAALQRLEGARYIVEARLPDPETGSLGTPGPQAGSLKERPLASLMRYCEDYVLTCRLEVWRGKERAVIGYRRGEIVSTSVGGAEGSDRLPEVMAWTEGSYEIVLPPPTLPPSRKGAARAAEPMAKTERKRHSTLPMASSPGTDATPEPAASGHAANPPTAPTHPAGPTPPPPVRPAAATLKPPTAGAPPLAQTPRLPASQAAPSPREAAVAKPATQPAVQHPASPASPQVSRPAGPAAPPPPIVRPPAPAVSASPVASALPPSPAAQPPARAAGPAQPAPPTRPVVQTGVPATTPRPPAPAQPATQAVHPAALGQPATQAVHPAAPAQPAGRLVSHAPGSRPEAAPAAMPPAVPAGTAPARPPARAPTPAMGSRIASIPREPAGPDLTARGTPPVPIAPLIPAQPARATAQPTPPPLTQAKTAGASKSPSPAGEAMQAFPARQDVATPPPAVSSALPATPPPFQLAPPAPARTHKPAPASNDLKPASGIIESRGRHPNHLPPAAAPVEIADQPELAADPQASSPAMVGSRPSGSRRARVARKGAGDTSVKVYVLIGLAVGAGIVAAYWAYWYLPFWHH